MRQKSLQFLQKLEAKTRNPLVGVFVLFVISAIIALALGSNLQPTENNGEQAMQYELPSIMDLYPQALSNAQGWYTDAYMVSADISIRGLSVWTTFIFETMSTPKEGLLVTFRQKQDGYEIELKEVDGPGKTENDPPINLDDWEVDSVLVGQTVFERRGSDFMEEYPGVDRVLLQLTRVSGSASENIGLEINKIVWIMHYHQTQGAELRVYVDPTSGEIIGERFFDGVMDGEIDL